MTGVERIFCATVVGTLLAFSGAAAAQNGGDDGTDGDQASGPVAPDQPVSAEWVGVSGGVLVGAELVLGIEAAFGVDEAWALIVFPIVGAAGGGVGGYFLEEASPEGAVALLVTGLAALIPTAVAVSASTAYDPEEEGAVVDESAAGASYSFEQTPVAGEAEGETTTQVESRPEGLPEGTPPLPGSGGQGGAAPEGSPPPESPPPEGSVDSQSRGEESSRQAAARHLASGSLFHVDHTLGAGFGVPAVDVRPTSLTAERAMLGAERGIEIHVPMLRVDLP
ncbi:MAG: hypothetical protein R6V85_02500 [Polyangia bacterium]